MITAKAEPLDRLPAYGQLGLYRFTLRNESTFPIHLGRVEAIEGWRRPLAQISRELEIRGNGDSARRNSNARLLLPGQALPIDVPYRAIQRKERLLLVFWRDDAETPGGDGEVRDLDPLRISGRQIGNPPSGPLTKGGPNAEEAVVEVFIPLPPRPFDPWARVQGAEEWTYSSTLGGFVVRLPYGELRLLLDEGSETLPSLPFALLDDVEARPDGVRIHRDREGVTMVTSRTLAAFLRDVAAAGLKIVRPAPDVDADYQVR